MDRRTHTEFGSGVPDARKDFGRLPARTNTVLAEVLMRLLTRENMTGMNAVFDASTTRLSAVVHALETEYGWSIKRDDLAVDCADGRVATVRRYWLDNDCIERATGAFGWCAEVKLARANLRKKAAKAKQIPKRHNRKSSPGAFASQFDLFGAEEAAHGQRP